MQIWALGILTSLVIVVWITFLVHLPARHQVTMAGFFEQFVAFGTDIGMSRLPPPTISPLESTNANIAIGASRSLESSQIPLQWAKSGNSSLILHGDRRPLQNGLQPPPTHDQMMHQSEYEANTTQSALSASCASSKPYSASSPSIPLSSP